MTATISPAAIDHIADVIALAAHSTALPKAAAIVNDGLTHATDLPGHYLVRSVTDPDTWYITTTASCTCKSALHRGHCKHQLAITLRTLATAAA